MAENVKATEIQPEDARSRQNLRAMGYDEILRRVREMFPKYNRSEIRQLARKLHQEAWRKRDVSAVDNLMKRE